MRPRRPALLQALRYCPWLLLAVACLEEDDALTDGQSGNGAVAPGRAGTDGAAASMSLAGASGSASDLGGAGGAGVVGTTQSSTSGTGGSSSASVDPSEEEQSGETGIFVGMTAAHNATRRELMLDPPLPDLIWSQELADFAQEWADVLATQCGVIQHRDQDSYGENIAMRGSIGLNLPYAAEQAVQSWADEKECWDFGTIQGSESCDPLCIGALNSTGCGHYTQIVWRSTQEVGCGYSTCQSGGYNIEVWVCNYDPPGNYSGEAPY